MLPDRPGGDDECGRLLSTYSRGDVQTCYTQTRRVCDGEYGGVVEQDADNRRIAGDQVTADKELGPTAIR